MNVTIQKSDLQRALTLCQGVVERRNTIPILGNVLLLRDGELLTVRATDMDMELALTIHASFATGKNPLAGFTLPAHTLADVVKKAAGDSISIAAYDANALLTAGNAKYRLGTLPTDDMPTFAGIENGYAFTMSATALAALIDTTRNSMSSEETRYYLCGIYLERNPENGALRAVATDGHRLAMADEPVEGELPEELPGFILPAKAVAQLRKLLDAHEGKVDVIVTDRLACFTQGETVFKTKLIDGQYPDYRRIIPSQCNHQALLMTDLLAGAVNRVTTVCNAKTKAVKLVFTNDNVTVSANDTDGNSADEVVDVKDYHGPDLTIGFNAVYLQAALERMNTETRFQFGDNGSPAKLLTMADNHPDPHRLHILMPMRV